MCEEEVGREDERAGGEDDDYIPRSVCVGWDNDVGVG